MQGIMSLKFIFRDSFIANCIVGYAADDPDDPPTVQELSLPKIIICLSSHIFRELSVRKNTFFLWSKEIIWNHFSHFNIPFIRKSSSTYAV